MVWTFQTNIGYDTDGQPDEVLHASYELADKHGKQYGTWLLDVFVQDDSQLFIESQLISRNRRFPDFQGSALTQEFGQLLRANRTSFNRASELPAKLDFYLDIAPQIVQSARKITPDTPASELREVVAAFDKEFDRVAAMD